MAVKIVTDLHSAVGALKEQVEPSDTLLLLGDLVNIIDYQNMDGILVELFDEPTVMEVAALRAERRFDEARLVMARRREGREDEMTARWEELQRREYRQVFEAVPEVTYLILGNVDSPRIVREMLPPHVRLIDDDVIEIEGLRVGFVGGGLPTPLNIPGEITEAEFEARLDRVAGRSPVDVICTHMPPDLPELTFDTVAQRHERGSSHLVHFIEQVVPQTAYFGHIHQPLVSSSHIGTTHLVNAGYFRRTKRALTLVD